MAHRRCVYQVFRLPLGTTAARGIAPPRHPLIDPPGFAGALRVTQVLDGDALPRSRSLAR